MDLGETSFSPTKEPINYDDSPYKKRNTSLSNQNIENEPLDIMDCLLLNDPDVKFEPYDESESAEPNVFAGETDSNNVYHIHENTNAENPVDISNDNLNTISSGQVPVIRQIVINGQTRTCVLVNNPLLKQSIMEGLENARKTSSIPPSLEVANANQNNMHSMVNCCRCGSLVHMNSFRTHIDSCPPRKFKTKDIATPMADQNQTVQTIYNPATGKVVTLDNNKTNSGYQNPNVLNNNNGNVPKFKVTTDKKTNLINSAHNTVSSDRIYKRFISSYNNSPQGNNLNLETSRTNDDGLQSKTNNDHIFQNSDMLLKTLLISSPKVPSNQSSQSSPISINQPQLLDNTQYRKSKDTTLHQIKKISNEIRDINAVLYCNKCNFCSSSLILMDIHMKKHADSSILTTLKNKITPTTQNIRTSRKINIGSAKSSGTTSEYKVLPKVVQDILIDFQSESNGTNTNITGDVENIALKSMGSRNRAVFKDKTSEQIQSKRVQEVDEFGNKVLPKVVQDILIDFQSESNVTNTNITGDVENIASKSMGSRNRAVFKDKTSEQIQSKRVQEVDKFGSKVSDNKLVCVEKNVIGSKTPKTLLGTCNNPKPTNVYGQTNGQYDSSPATESLLFKSACELAENTGVIASSSSPQSMGTRSKSFSIKNNERLTNSNLILPPMRTRSKSFCAEKVAEQKACRNMQGNKANDEKNGKEKNYALERSRSISVLKDNYKHESLLESVGLKRVTSSNSLNVSVTNRPNLSHNIDKLSVNNSNSVCETGNYNSQADSEINVTNDNDDDSINQDFNNLLLLKDSTFSCSLCSFTTDKKRSLIDHERNHKKTKQPIFRCIYCGQRYTRYMLYLHIQSVHPGQKFQIREEVNMVSEKTMHKCSTCWFSTTDQEKFALHIKGHPATTVESKDASDSNKVALICFACSFKTSEHKQLKLHLANHAFTPVKQTDSSGTPIFNCEFCSYNSKILSKAICHMGSHKNNRKIKTCPQCNFKSTGNALFYHIQNCRSKSKSTKKLNLNNLVSKAPNGKKSAVASRTRLVKPMLANTNLHTLFKPVARPGHKFFDCKMCSYGCPSFKDMCIHINSHKKNLPIIKCSNCTFKSTRCALKYHMKKCKRSTRLEGQNSENGLVKPGMSMLAKSKIHTPVKRIDNCGRVVFGCKMCSYGCSYLKGIISHINSHKNNRLLIKCPRCTFKSTALATKRHMDICKNPILTDGPNNGHESGAGQVHPEILNAKVAKFNIHTNRPVRRCGRKLFNCKMCSYGSSWLKDVVVHIKSHKNNLPIKKCPKCNFKSTRNALRHHIKKCKNSTSANDQNNDYESGAGQVNSEMSTAQLVKFNKRSLFKPVKRINESGRAWFDCNMCSYGCPQLRDIVVHFGSHKKNLPINNCPNCYFKSTRRALTSHMRKCKSTSAKISKSKGKSDSKKVKIDQKSIVVVKTKPKSLFKCTKCSFLTSLRIKLKIHIRKRHLKTPRPQTLIKNTSPQEFNCSRCSFSTNLRLKLNLHQKTCVAAKEHQFRCKLCSLVTPNKGAYQRHVQCHAKRFPIKKCPRCTFKSTFHALKIHMQKSGHDGDCINSSNSKKSIFQCSQCPYSTYLRIKLNSHIRKRHQQMATKHFTELDDFFQCNYCSYVAKRLNICKRHTNTHLKYNLPIKKCVNCDYRSTFYALRSHSLDCKGYVNKITVSEDREVIRNDQDIFKENNGETCQDDLQVVDSPNTNISKIFSCRLCSYNTNSQYNLRRHKNTHRYQPVLQCTHCTYRSTLYALSVHSKKCVYRIISLKSKNNDIVSKAPLNHPEQKNLEENDLSPEKITKNNSPKSFKCQYCSFTSFCSYLIDRHMDSHTLLKLPVTQCAKCEYKSTPATLLAHAKTCTGKQLTDKPTAKRVESNFMTTPKTGKASKKNLKEVKAPANIQLRKHNDSSKREVQKQLIADVANFSDSSKVGSRSLIVNIYLNNELYNDSEKDMLTVSEKESKIDVSSNTPSLGSQPSPVFRCPKCSFATTLRIKLNFHLRKCICK